jgi:Uncharacterised nucleotidyltransferase
MFRREAFAMPHADQLGELRRVILSEGRVEPMMPARFVTAAVDHRVLGSCVQALDEDRLVLGEREARPLRDAHAVAALGTALAARELPAVAAAVESATSAPAIVLKGPAISDRLYSDPALRPYADLDLMVARESLEEAKTALSAIGYEERVQLRPGFEIAHGHTLDMVRAVGRKSVEVEVHWRLSDDRVGEAISHSALSGGAEPVPGVPGVAFPSLPDQLVVCALHLMSHREKRLAWVEDIRRLNLLATEEQWDAGFRRAQQLGLLWVLNRALDYVERHLGLAAGRPIGPGPPPAFGPVRAVEELDLQASVNIGRLAALPWRQRPALVRDILVPSRAGLDGLVGGDGAGRFRMVARHVRLIARGVAMRR